MLVAHLTRVTPGRPEAQLGCITITPMRPSRIGDATRYTAHFAGLDGDNLPVEQHVEIPAWDGARPPLELLQHALELAHTVAAVEQGTRERAVVLDEPTFRKAAAAALKHGVFDETVREDLERCLAALDTPVEARA